MKANMFCIIAVVAILSGCAGRSNFALHNEGAIGTPNPKQAAEDGSLQSITFFPVEMSIDVLKTMKVSTSEKGKKGGIGFAPVAVLTTDGRVAAGRYYFQRFHPANQTAMGQVEVWNVPFEKIDRFMLLDKNAGRAFRHNESEILAEASFTKDKKSVKVMKPPFESTKFSDELEYQKSILAQYGVARSELVAYFGNDMSDDRFYEEIHVGTPEWDEHIRKTQEMLTDGDLSVYTLADGKSYLSPLTRQEFVDYVAKFDGQTTASRYASGAKVAFAGSLFLDPTLGVLSASNVLAQAIAASLSSAPSQDDPETINWIIEEQRKMYRRLVNKKTERIMSALRPEEGT